MKITVSRRAFLKTAALSAAAVSIPLSIKAVEKKSANEVYGRTSSQTWCEMCFWGCGVTAYSRNGKVYKLEGQKLCPNNYGSLCAKGNAGIYQVYDPDRLKKPLIRVGKRGEGKFREATWEEATKYVAENLKKVVTDYKPKGVSLIAHGSGEHAFITLMELIGSKNTAIPAYSQCMGSREIAWWLTFGAGFSGHEYGDGENAKCMMFLGRNILESLQVGEAKKVINGLSKGAKLIYVDSRYTKTAAKADHFLQIKPGTDLALLLGMINFIIQNKLYNEKFVDEYCFGFEELKEEVKDYSLEWTSKETDIDSAKIADICYELANAAPSCFIHPGRRLTRYGNDTQTVRAIGILNGLFGNWGYPGGFYNVQQPPVKAHQVCEIENEEHCDCGVRADGAGTDYKLAPGNLGRENGLFQAILTDKPYPVKALIAYGTNFFQHFPDYETGKKIAEKLDFIVTCDIYMTETALYSDVILPESTYLERQDPIVTQGDQYPFMQYREPAVSPLFDTKGAWEISKMIAGYMEFKSHWKSIDEVNGEILKDSGVTLERLKKDGCCVFPVTENIYPQAEGKDLEFATASRKVELYSSFLEKLGFDAIPKYSRPKQNPLGQFRLTFGRMSYHTHARTQNNRWLLALHDYKQNVWINSVKAYELGINNGDKVVLKQGEKKSGVLTAFVTDGIHPEALFIPHGFGRFSKFMKSAYEMQGASDADFCSNDVDPISGASAFQNAFVRIEKA